MSGITYGVALIILFFILPGGLFRRAYFPLHLSNYHLRASSFSEIATTLGVGMTMQCIAILLVNHFHPTLMVDFKLIASLLSAPSPFVLGQIQGKLWHIFLYNMVLLTLSFVLGKGLQRIVLRFGLDERFRALKYDNSFHYVFSGKQYAWRHSDEILSYMNVCVKIDNDFFIYSGILLDYQLNKDGHCELIELGKVKRKVINKENDALSNMLKKNHHHEYNIHCDKLFIPYNQILNFGITYYKIREV
jgi:hypothetical protein